MLNEVNVIVICAIVTTMAMNFISFQTVMKYVISLYLKIHVIVLTPIERFYEITTSQKSTKPFVQPFYSLL